MSAGLRELIRRVLGEPREPERPCERHREKGPPVRVNPVALLPPPGPPADPKARARACFEPRDPSPIRLADKARMARMEAEHPKESDETFFERRAAAKAQVARQQEAARRQRAVAERLREEDIARARARAEEMVKEAREEQAAREEAQKAQLVHIRPDLVAKGDIHAWVNYPLRRVELGNVSMIALMDGFIACLGEVASWEPEKRERATGYLRAVLDHLEQSPGIPRFSNTSASQATLGYVLDIPGGDYRPALPDLRYSDFDRGVVCYAKPESPYPLTTHMFERHREYLEQLWGGPVEILPATSAGMPRHGAVVVRPAEQGVAAEPAGEALPKVIPLSPPPDGRIVLGTDVFTGEVVAREVSVLPHMLIMGTSGFGKSVFLHQVVSQLAGRPDVERVHIVDLKGGVEFQRYTAGNVRTVWQFEDVATTVRALIGTFESRLREMVMRQERTWRRPRTFLIIDEFAQIQLWPVVGKEEKAARDRLLADLNRLSMLGRAVGIVLIAAVQKATTDAMDSSFRNNLQGQVCFRVSSRLAAASMFGSTDDLRLDPVSLPRGRFIFHDPTVGETLYLQAHVAPLAAD